MCDYLDCSFLALTKAGLTNHQRQRHATNPKIPFQYCYATKCSSTSRDFTTTRGSIRHKLSADWPASPPLWCLWSSAADGWCVCVCLCMCIGTSWVAWFHGSGVLIGVKIFSGLHITGTELSAAENLLPSREGILLHSIFP